MKQYCNRRYVWWVFGHIGLKVLKRRHLRPYQDKGKLRVRLYGEREKKVIGYAPAALAAGAGVSFWWNKIMGKRRKRYPVPVTSAARAELYFLSIHGQRTLIKKTKRYVPHLLQIYINALIM